MRDGGAAPAGLVRSETSGRRRSHPPGATRSPRQKLAGTWPCAAALALRKSAARPAFGAKVLEVEAERHAEKRGPAS